MLNRDMFNFKKNDEYYTPRYVVKAIIPFLKEQRIKRILCPADKKESAFVSVINDKTNIEIIYNHIDYENGDFLKRQKEDYKNIDLIITNPPFSLKLDFIKKANELEIPYMFLLGLQVLNYKGIATLMRDTEASLIYLVGSRISYDGNTSTFQSSFITNLIKNKIVYVDLNKEE